MKNRRVTGFVVLIVMTVLLLCAAGAEENEGWLSHYQPTPGAEILDYIETQELFASLADKTLLAASGAGAWEGRLNVDAAGWFEGYYYDADAGDEIIYEVSFSGNFAANAEVHDNTYWLWVQDLTTTQAPGTEAKSVYGDQIVYTDAPFEKDTFMVLTLIHTPTEKIPETVRDEIGGTSGEWDDYSRFVTLTRQSDGWGFFADGYESNRREFEPIATAVPAATPTPEPDYQPVKKTLLPNGNMYYDFGLIAFETPADCNFGMAQAVGRGEKCDVTCFLRMPYRPEYEASLKKAFPLNEDVQGLPLTIANVYTLFYNEGEDVESIAWSAHEGKGYECGFTEVAGHKAHWARNVEGAAKVDRGYIATEYLVPLTGNRILQFLVVDYEDGTLKKEAELFLSTLEIRDDLAAVLPAGETTSEPEITVDKDSSISENPVGPGEGITYEDNGNGSFTEVRPTPEPEPAGEGITYEDNGNGSFTEVRPAPEPEPAGESEIPAGEWVDCWMGGGDAMGEMVTWLKEDGSLWMKVFFQRTFEIEAELKPLDWNRRSFETEYGHYSGVVTWVNERELTFAITGGMSMEDDESEWYYLFKNREYSFSPVDYNDLWYEAPAEGPEDDGDWLGNWTTLGTDMKSTIRIIRGMQGNFIMQLTFSNGYMIAGELEQVDSRRMDFDAEEFGAILTLNRKHRMILLTDAGSMNDAANEALDAFHYMIEYSPEVYE